jgi:GntR family transcriptional regulator
MSTVGVLDRESAVPLYYQLQELIRQQIESAVWVPGEGLPTEHELCRLHGVSRACVRQALSILEADGAIIRRRGRGTFVAPSRLASSVPGLARTLIAPAPGGPAIRVLDRRTGSVDASVCGVLGVAAQDVLRLTTLWSSQDVAYAIGVSFFRRADVGWLDAVARPGRVLAAAAAPPRLTLAVAEVCVETTACGRYEAERLGIPDRTTLMVTVSVHHDAADGRPFEVTRLGYRGDRVQLRFRGTPVLALRPAAWAFGVANSSAEEPGGIQLHRQP